MSFMPGSNRTHATVLLYTMHASTRMQMHTHEVICTFKYIYTRMHTNVCKYVHRQKLYKYTHTLRQQYYLCLYLCLCVWGCVGVFVWVGGCICVCICVCIC